VNYEYIKEQILEKIKETVYPQGLPLQENDYELKFKNQNLEYKNKIWFYSSDYSDIL
jgi:hypothetical protein